MFKGALNRLKGIFKSDSEQPSQDVTTGSHQINADNIRGGHADSLWVDESRLMGSIVENLVKEKLDFYSIAYRYCNHSKKKQQIKKKIKYWEDYLKDFTKYC